MKLGDTFQKARPSLSYRLLMVLWFITAVPFSEAQSFRHWTRNFNDESSLLAGAVVGGGIGPSAIYFNPANISEARNSSLSINTSLLSFNFYDISNALGEDMKLNYSHFQVQPRFISYLISPKRNENFQVEIAFLNNENIKLDFNTANNQYLDILKHLPGEERYFASFQFYNSFRDDWVGIGTSWKISDHFHLGASMFVVVKSLEYRFDLDIQAFPLSDTVQSGNELIPFYVASYKEKEYYHFNDYRLLWKMGMMYKNERLQLGLVVRSPSIHVYSDGKRILHNQGQANITHPETGEFLPNYELADYKEKREVKVNFKDPFSIAAGLTLFSNDGRKTLFTTVEFFTGYEPHNFIQAPSEEQSLFGGISPVGIEEGWLAYTHHVKPVVNAAIGYRVDMKGGMTMMGGFRTDFNYRDVSDDKDKIEDNIQKALTLDVYHVTWGVRVRVLGQDLMAGLQYSFGWNKGLRQYINLTDPVEYNLVEQAPLQGVRQDNMKVMHQSISLYLGATFNFGNGK